MPYHWTRTDQTQILIVTQHQSMTAKGFVTFMGSTLFLVAIPLVAVLGTPTLWVLLGFVGLAIGGVWYAIQRNQIDGTQSETLTITPDRIDLVHRDAKGREKTWSANPYWVSVHLHKGEKPVAKYLTLKGGGREVELGVFLTPEERQALYGDLKDALAAA